MKTQRLTVLSLALLFTVHLSAQEAIEKQVNKQVWKPFVKSMAESDFKTYNDLHTDDVLRISERGIKIGKEYKDSNKSSMEYTAGTAIKQNIEFWFEHRVYSGDVGYEVGYYKITVNMPDQDPKYYYARFHVVLRKEKGRWKIAQDWDTGNINGHEVTEEDWKKGKAIDF